jgi:hypothetical protein
MVGLNFQAACPSVPEIKTVAPWSASRAQYPTRPYGFEGIQLTSEVIPTGRCLIPMVAATAVSQWISMRDLLNSDAGVAIGLGRWKGSCSFMR